MPSFQIHLAIAKRYMEKHIIQNRDAFMEGSIAPDFVRPKEKSHYTIGIAGEDLIENAKNKVDIKRYLKENKVETDYEKGVFLHLLTDKIFFTEFFDEDFLRHSTYHSFTEDLYVSYNQTNRLYRRKISFRVKRRDDGKNKRRYYKIKERKRINIKRGKKYFTNR